MSQGDWMPESAELTHSSLLKPSELIDVSSIYRLLNRSESAIWAQRNVVSMETKV